MSTQFNFDNNNHEFNSSQNRVKVTDLLSRMNEEKNREKKKLSSWCCGSIGCNSFWYNSYYLKL